MIDINKLTEERNKKRDEIQKYIIKDWVDNNRYGSYIVSMGLGKGKIIADSILSTLADKEAFSNIKDKEIPILVQVSSEYLRDVDTVKELIHWGVPKDLFRDNFIEFVCYQSSSRWKKDKNIGLLISDEIDFSSTEKYSQVFVIQQPVYSLGLTGTLISEKEEFTQELPYFPPVRYKYPIEQAQKDGIINKTIVFIHEVPLSTEKTIRVDYTNKNTKKVEHFYTSEQEQYLYIEKEILKATIKLSSAQKIVRDSSYSMEDRDRASLSIPKLINRLKYLQFSPSNKNSRANITYNLQSLTDYTLRLKDVILNNPDINKSDTISKPNKLIIFSKYTDIVDKLTDYGFHGKISKEDGDIIVDKFNFNEIRDIGVVKKANRGINFTNLNHCIAHSFTSSETDYLQGTKGRMTRLPIYRNAYLHVLYSYYYVKDKNGNMIKKYCQNKTWADSFLEGETNEIHHIYSIEDCISKIIELEHNNLMSIGYEDK